MEYIDYYISQYWCSEFAYSVALVSYFLRNPLRFFRMHFNALVCVTFLAHTYVLESAYQRISSKYVHVNGVFKD